MRFAVSSVYSRASGCLACSFTKISVNLRKLGMFDHHVPALRQLQSLRSILFAESFIRLSAPCSESSSRFAEVEGFSLPRAPKVADFTPARMLRLSCCHQVILGVDTTS